MYNIIFDIFILFTLNHNCSIIIFDIIIVGTISTHNTQM